MACALACCPWSPACYSSTDADRDLGGDTGDAPSADAPEDAAPPWEDCLAALAGAREGEPCDPAGLVCAYPVGCLGPQVECPAGRIHRRDDAVHLDPECPTAAANVDGSGPDGPLSLRRAWARLTTGFDTRLTLALTPHLPASSCAADPELAVAFTVALDPEGVPAFLGEHRAEAIWISRLSAHPLPAVVHLEEVRGVGADAVFVGRIRLLADDWDLSGEFTAPSCPALYAVIP